MKLISGFRSQARSSSGERGLIIGKGLERGSWHATDVLFLYQVVLIRCVQFVKVPQAVYS